MLAEAGLLLAAFVAGCLDAVIGGGGLVQLPALFGVYPTSAPAWLMGTNKIASIFGTSSAAWRYTQQLRLDWRLLLKAAALAFVGAFVGAITVSHVAPGVFKALVPLLLSGVLLYTLLQRGLGREHAPVQPVGIMAVLALGLFAALGFYDGFFGPGAGSLLMLVMVRMYGFDFLHAAASARVVNVATNLAALSWFGAHGQVGWLLGFAMAGMNIGGSLLGTRLALRGGTRWIRVAFIGIVTLLIAKTAWDAAVLLGWRR
jgi:uncharacterized protein